MILPSWYTEDLARRSLRVLTVDPTEQVTLVEARLHLRLDTYGSPEYHPDDGLISDIYLPAAREYCEMISGYALTSQYYAYTLNNFPYYSQRVEIPIDPVTAVHSIAYLDSNGDTIVMDPATYKIDNYSRPGYIVPAYSVVWPTVALGTPNAITITLEAGYDTVANSPGAFPMPKKYKTAMLLMLTHYYENRSEVDAVNLKELPMGVKTLIMPDSFRRGFA